MKLEDDEHRALALWACDCAEHVLARFENDRPWDRRPRDAIAAGRSWARGDLPMSQARAAAFAAHAAAREAEGAARESARAAGHAAATAHVASHAAHAGAYALKAVSAAGADIVEERAWQHARLPSPLRPVAFPAP